MKSFMNALPLALLLCVALTRGNSSVRATSQGETQQNRVVGEVLQTNPSAKRLTIKTESGEIEVIANETTALLRIPPGETSADKANRISFGEIVIGDRLFARVSVSEPGKPLQASQ